MSELIESSNKMASQLGEEQKNKLKEEDFKIIMIMVKSAIEIVATLKKEWSKRIIFYQKMNTVMKTDLEVIENISINSNIANF